MIFDFQSSLGGEVKRKLEENLVTALLVFPTKITTLDGDVFYWNIKEYVLSSSRWTTSVQNNLIDNWHFLIYLRLCRVKKYSETLKF